VIQPIREQSGVYERFESREGNMRNPLDKLQKMAG
jgi:hypothetical protein